MPRLEAAPPPQTPHQTAAPFYPVPPLPFHHPRSPARQGATSAAPLLQQHLLNFLRSAPGRRHHRRKRRRRWVRLYLQAAAVYAVRFVDVALAAAVHHHWEHYYCVSSLVPTTRGLLSRQEMHRDGRAPTRADLLVVRTLSFVALRQARGIRFLLSWSRCRRRRAASCRGARARPWQWRRVR